MECGWRFRWCAAERPIPAEAIPAGARACASWSDVVSAPDVDIVVETIGGNGIPREIVNQALNSGKPVVTANKTLIAKYGDEILALAASAACRSASRRPRREESRLCARCAARPPAIK